jgi:2'-5' RNA ligase
MRLFTGIAIPESVLHSLERLVEHLRPTAHLKWSPIYNFHVTTKFIGEWPPQRLEELKRVLAEIPPTGPIPIRIEGLGWFPNPHNPRVFWAGIQAPPALAGLAHATDQALSLLGITAETRAFSPHLTLARIKEPVPLVQIRRAVAELTSVDFGEFTAESFHLYLSEPGPSGSLYTSLAEYPLSR